MATEPLRLGSATADAARIRAGRARLACAFACAAMMSGAAFDARAEAPVVPAAAASASRESAPCPQGVAAGARCVAGRDSFGAYYWLAVPAAWNGTLVLHAHGGPDLGPPRRERATEDLRRWSIWSRAGFAYAGTTYHQGGVAVTSAAEDIERLRRLFVAEFGLPKRTILHGQSWGAGVAAKAAELASASVEGHHAPLPYDGVLLTSGVLGGTHSYDFRLDLRVVYEAVCGNHPLPDEPAYPLWQGLPPASTLKRSELAARVDACTGVREKGDQRSDEQQRHLKTITDVVRIPERTLISHLQWATWQFHDIADRLGGRNAFANVGVRYRGSADDDALNAKVARYAADPAALAAFAADVDPTGRIAVPVLTVHAIDDPQAFVELESTFRETMERGGSGGRLVQVFTDDHEHSYLTDAAYVTAIGAVLDWIEHGTKPTPQRIAARCPSAAAAFDASNGCRFRPDYVPPPLSARVPPR